MMISRYCDIGSSGGIGAARPAFVNLAAGSGTKLARSRSTFWFR